jgi:hypothetical protein
MFVTQISRYIQCLVLSAVGLVPCLVPVLFTFQIQGVLKFKIKFCRQKFNGRQRKATNGQIKGNYEWLYHASFVLTSPSVLD